MALNESSTLHKEVRVTAPIKEVWDAWTTESGVATFFAPESKIELRPGGPYEIYFVPDAPEGLKGGEGNTILEFHPPVKLVFTWSFPPSIPELRNSGAQTTVTVTLEEESAGSTKVTLIQSEWKSGQEWDKGYAYFDRA